MAARIRHIALCVKDIKATADFYEKAFGLKRTPIREGATAWNCYLSDGEVNLALLSTRARSAPACRRALSASTISVFSATTYPRNKRKLRQRAESFSSILANPRTTGSNA